MTSRRKSALACLAAALTIGAVGAQAQWVAVARAVAGRIQQMSNRNQEGSGFDVATVVLEANADKVYATAIKNLSARTDVKITQQDARRRLVQFTNGVQVASLQATPLGEKLTQLVVASNLTPTQPDTTSLVVQGVLKVCKEMNVDCTVANE
jgi:hypothetical protein